MLHSLSHPVVLLTIALFVIILGSLHHAQKTPNPRLAHILMLVASGLMLPLSLVEWFYLRP